MEQLQEKDLTNEAPELPKRAYLQDTDFVAQEFEFLFRHRLAIHPRSAKCQQPIGISGGSMVTSQAFWQNKDLQTQEKQESHYMSLIKMRESKEQHDNLYQSLICGQVLSTEHSSGLVETLTADNDYQELSLENLTTENDYQELDFTRINPLCDSTYQDLIPFHKDKPNS